MSAKKSKKEKEEKKEEFQFKEPRYGHLLKLKIVPIEKLDVVPHQRKPSEYHVRHLVSSIERVGFLVPVIAIEKDDKYLILDGQHRLLAAKKIGLENLPVILVPERIADLMMNLNIEKELNIREKSYVALNIYREYLQKNPTLLESDPLLADSIEQAYYVTLGIAYEKQEKTRGGTLESILKKCDFFLDQEIEKAILEREKRADKVVKIDALIKSIVEKLRERGKWHPFVYQQVVSFANPYKKKRLPVEFEEMFSQLKENLEKAEKHPELVLKEEISEF